MIENCWNVEYDTLVNVTFLFCAKPNFWETSRDMDTCETYTPCIRLRPTESVPDSTRLCFGVVGCALTDEEQKVSSRVENLTRWSYLD